MVDISSRLGLDYGLDRITYAEDEVSLPREGRLPPSDDVNRARLEEILWLATLDEVLGEELRPYVDDRAVLLPDTYNRLLHEAVDELKVALEAETDPETTKVLRSLLRLLNEEKGLQDLLDWYRSALYQG